MSSFWGIFVKNKGKMLSETLHWMIIVCVFAWKIQGSFGQGPDNIVQAACAASFSGGFVSAIRKKCGGSKTCATVCKEAGASMRTIYGHQGSTIPTCFNAFHFYYRARYLHPKTVGKARLAMYRYGSAGCHASYCGPNYVPKTNSLYSSSGSIAQVLKEDLTVMSGCGNPHTASSWSVIRVPSWWKRAFNCCKSQMQLQLPVA
ncbi:uncharacterized protein LOC134238305 [Saccostrea cucullata]|uniref:uncharacterized protein LOC134238305 n=1 Tax=Saccostrea cuccullata TaxID=36930 RepID=UPI002ED167E8